MSDETTALGALTAAEIETQPAVWARALGESAEWAPMLPHAGETILGVGCGTSYYVLEAYAHRRQELQATITRATIASEFDELDTYDRVLYLSRSGTTSELLRLQERLAGSVRTVAICGTADSPLTQVVDDVILIPYADEQSVVQTRFATTALNVLRASAGEDLAGLPDAAEEALSEPLPIAPGDHDHLVFLGTGWTAGLAHEAALKCREAALIHAEAYALGEYRHGPIAVAGPGTAVWSFAPVPADVRDAIFATGAHLVEPRRDPVADLVMVHRLALAIARAKGIDADSPRHLSRSVVVT